MTDRELLELAAEAAGIERILWNDANPGGWVLTQDGRPISGQLWWNPLTDDGDALRLAVRLKLPLWMNSSGCNAGEGAVCKTVDVDDTGGDIYAATRRAIVRAAAEIGRSLP